MLIFSALFLFACAPGRLSPEEQEVFGEGALAGQAITFACKDATVESCIESVESVQVVTASRTDSRGTIFRGRGYTFADRCDQRIAVDYSCTSSTNLRLCRTQCERSESCNAGQCVSACGNSRVDRGETCTSCPADVQCGAGQVCQEGSCISRCTPAAEMCDGVDNSCDGAIDEGSVCNDITNCGMFGNACAAGQSCQEGVCVADCIDTDPSDDIAIQGTVTVAATGYSQADYCELGIAPGSRIRRILLHQVSCDASAINGVHVFQTDCDARGYGSRCQEGRCLQEICDGLDNDFDGIVDEYCDDDNDNYCDARMIVEGTPAVCPNGGGDCGDSLLLINPGAVDVCSNYYDDNCNGIINDGCPVPSCTPESVIVPLNFRQPLREVKPTVTATDLPTLLAADTVTNDFGTSTYTQELSFEAVNSSITFEESDDDITSHFFLAKNNQPIALYKISFSEPFQSNIVGSNLEDFVGARIGIFGNTYTISEAKRYSQNNISLIFLGEDVSIILSDNNITLSGIGSRRVYAGDGSNNYYSVPDYNQDGSATINGEPVDGLRVMIEGVDNSDTFQINQIMVNMTAQDEYHVGRGQLLSDIIPAAGNEQELLFTNNWDIRFNDFDTATNSGIVEIGKICPTYPPVCIDNDADAANPELVPSGTLGLGLWEYNLWSRREYNPWSMQLRGDTCQANPEGGVRVFERYCSPDSQLAYGRMIACPAGTTCVTENSCG